MRINLSTVLLLDLPSMLAAFSCTVQYQKRTQLFSKNSDRARLERSLEDMMGNDWRVFRARLVAQEQAEQAERLQQETESDMDEDKLAKQNQLGDLFAGAISSIFSQPRKKESTRDLFDGTSIGGLPYSEDPFVSEAELPILLQPKAMIDKHRWAHEIPHVEPGSVLIANEGLTGSFRQTVVLVIQHCEKTGSIGVVINRPLEGDLLQVASKTGSNLDLSLKLAFTSSAVTYGGPVLQEDFTVIHGYGEVEGSTKVCPGVYVGGSEELMEEVRVNRFNPKHALFIKGHSAWVPGQLSREIADGVWYIAAASSDFILRYAGAPVAKKESQRNLWADILQCLGGKYAEIAQTHGVHGDARLP